MSEIYSYHTFLFPFIWEGRGKNTVTLSEFLDCFEKNENWVNVDIPDEHHITSNPQILNMDDALLFYKEYQYFHPYARKAIYGFMEDIVTNFSFRPQDIRNKAHYYIEKTYEDGQLKKYDLHINGIKLKIFNTGVAIFIMECENHGAGLLIKNDGTKAPFSQKSLDAVKEINDYGRRVALPYIPTDWNSSAITADRLTLDVAGVGTFISDFRKFAESIDTLENFNHILSLTHFCDFIKDILAFGGDCRFTSKLTNESGTYYIYPALDDRMFVNCYIMDTDAVNKFTKRKDDGTLLCLDDSELSKSLHELIAVDSPEKCCTQDPLLRKKYLEEHIYTRWLDYSTLMSYSGQALINLTTEDCPPYLTDNFLTQYIQLCCLCLAQRASIINFQRQISAISAQIKERGRKIELTTVSEVMKLQERFVAFQNQLSFTEVTPQDQGIDIYNKLMEFCFIEKEIGSLKDQLQCLCDAANTSLDYNFNKYALIFAIPTLLFDVLGNYLELFEKCEKTYFFSKSALLAFAVIIVVYNLIKYRRRK